MKHLKTSSLLVCSLLVINSSALFAASPNQQPINQRINSIFQSHEVVSRLKSDTAYIPQGTIIPMELMEDLNSKHAEVGESIKFRILSNVLINNVVVIPQGSFAYGTITRARKGGMLGRSGKLEFVINHTYTINGVRVPLTYDSRKSGHSDGGAVAVVTFVSVVGGLFMKGTNAKCLAGTRFEVPVAENVDLGVPLDELAKDMSSPHGVSITIK